MSMIVHLLNQEANHYAKVILKSLFYHIYQENVDNDLIIIYFTIPSWLMDFASILARQFKTLIQKLLFMWTFAFCFYPEWYIGLQDQKNDFCYVKDSTYKGFIVLVINDLFLSNKKSLNTNQPIHEIVFSQLYECGWNGKENINILLYLQFPKYHAEIFQK